MDKVQEKRVKELQEKRLGQLKAMVISPLLILVFHILSKLFLSYKCYYVAHSPSKT